MKIDRAYELIEIQLILLVFGSRLHKSDYIDLRNEYRKILKELSIISVNPKFDNINSTIEEMQIVYDAPENFATLKSRKRKYVVPRQKCMFICKYLFPSMTLAEIGEYFNKDHATVLHSAKTVKNLIDTDFKYREEMRKMQKYFLGRVIYP